MSIFKCKMCGGTIEFEPGATVGVCDSCGTKQTLPRLDSDGTKPLEPIEGTPVDLLDPPKGCAFGPRCEHCMKVCLNNQPPMVEVGENHRSACWKQVQEMRMQQADGNRPEGGSHE